MDECSSAGGLNLRIFSLSSIPALYSQAFADGCFAKKQLILAPIVAHEQRGNRS
jgi:hypothetical protein